MISLIMVTKLGRYIAKLEEENRFKYPLYLFGKYRDI